jgi:hypothetical protein
MPSKLFQFEINQEKGQAHENCYVMHKFRPPLWSGGQSSWISTEMYCVSCEVRIEFIYVM